METIFKQYNTETLQILIKQYDIEILIKVAKMRQTPEKLILEKITVPPKKTTVEREFYVCFCAKNYNSYSALYLHAKKKHDLNLSMKFLKHTRHEWSGNVKNIYRQFVQCISDQEEEQSIVIELQKKSPRSSPIKSGSDVEKRKESFRMPYQDVRRLDNVIEKYIKEERKNQASITSIKRYQKFLANNYKYYQSQPQYSQHFSSSTLDYIPHLINQFFSQQPSSPSIISPKTPIKEQSIKIFEQFFDWLYTNSYTNYLAISREKYQVFTDQSKYKRENQREYRNSK